MIEECNILKIQLEKSNEHISTLEVDIKLQQQLFENAKKANEALKRRLNNAQREVGEAKQAKLKNDIQKQKLINSGLTDNQLSEIRERIIGALAYDIREDWSDCVNSRLELISQLGNRNVTAGDLYNY